MLFCKFTIATSEVYLHIYTGKAFCCILTYYRFYAYECRQNMKCKFLLMGAYEIIFCKVQLP